MKSFLNKLYFYKFFDSFLVIFPIFTLLFQKNGLSTFQISLVIIVWYVTQLVMEIPMGILADRYSRRNLLIIANIFQGICFLLWLGGNIWFFSFGFICWGIKNALTGGTFEALTYDGLTHFGKEHEYEKIIGTTEGWKFLGVSISALLAGFIAQYSFAFVLFLSTSASLLAAYIISKIPSVKKAYDIEEKNYFHALKISILEIKNNKALLFILLLSCVIFSAYGSADEFWALIYRHLGLQIDSIGIIIAIGYSMISLSGYSVHIFKNKLSKLLEYSFVLISSLLFIFVGSSKTVWVLPLVFLSIYLYQVANIKFGALLQHQIVSHHRATIFSIKNLLFELLGIIFLFIFGFFTNMLGIQSVLIVSGVITFSCAMIFFVLQKILKIPFR